MFFFVRAHNVINSGIITEMFRQRMNNNTMCLKSKSKKHITVGGGDGGGGVHYIQDHASFFFKML